MSNELGGVKVGDTIKCAQTFTRDAFDLFKVERLTGTQAICRAIGAATEYQCKFNLNTGLMIGTASGDGWHRRHGSIATDADFAAIAMKLRLRCARDAIGKLSITESNIEAVEALLKASKP